MYYLVKLLSLIPLNVLYIFSDLIYLLIYWVFKYRKKIVRQNISYAFQSWSRTQQRQIEKQFYRNFADFIVETIKGFSLSRDSTKKHVEFVNLPELLEILKQHKSVLFLTSHLFNWEWMQLSGALNFTVPIDYVYHPLHNQSTDELMLKLRGRFGAEPIKRKEAARKIYKKSSEGRGFAILADQFPSGKNKIFWTNFLGVETAFFYSIEQIARLAGLPVLYFHIIKTSRGIYKVKMVPLTFDPKAEVEGDIIRKYAAATEQNVLEQPDIYLWSHKRWKRTRAEQEVLSK